MIAIKSGYVVADDRTYHFRVSQYEDELGVGYLMTLEDSTGLECYTEYGYRGCKERAVSQAIEDIWAYISGNVSIATDVVPFINYTE